MNIRKLIIEDVRCFAGRQEFNIRPLTFLVGENSTGKTTVLGCFEILNNFMQGSYQGLDFNIEPYQMGSFADIARRSNPRKKSFRLGFAFYEEGEMEYVLDCIERETGSEPIVLEEKFSFENGEIILKETEPQAGAEAFKVILEKTDQIEKFTVETIQFFSGRHAFKQLEFLASSMQVEDEQDRSKLSPAKVEFQNFLNLSLPVWNQAAFFSFKTQSFAPTRSKPQRTYNPLKEAVTPEGSDMPVLLMNVSKADNKAWQQLKHRLVKFGKASGLFTDIEVRRLGKSTGDPFQLQIKVKGPKVNMIDVGYGVNQILPILVRIFNTAEKITFLMQQPEVHLHPRGQAELSSLLIDLLIDRVRPGSHSFIVETHSDYMVDRARIEIMNKRIAPEDVSLIYLEPVGNHVKVHNIAFDEQANFIHAPGSYREFFLKESDKLLGFA